MRLLLLRIRPAEDGVGDHTTNQFEGLAHATISKPAMGALEWVLAAAAGSPLGAGTDGARRR